MAEHDEEEPTSPRAVRALLLSSRSLQPRCSSACQSPRASPSAANAHQSSRLQTRLRAACASRSSLSPPPRPLSHRELTLLPRRNSCEKQISRYTCPSCNLPYCSLACFRDPQHQACLDHFQRATLAQDLDGDPHHAQPSQGDKNRMLDMLKKFEDQQRELEELERQDALDDDDDEADQSPEAVARRKERQELEKRLEGIDLGASALSLSRCWPSGAALTLLPHPADAVPPEHLLSLLSPSQQAAFSATLVDPARLTKLVEDQFEGDEPWWVEEDELRVLRDMRETSRRAAREAGGTVEGDGAGAGEDEDEDEDDEDPQLRPPVLHPEQLPPLKVGPDGRPLVSPKLLHNIAAVLCVARFLSRARASTAATGPDEPTPPLLPQLRLRLHAAHVFALVVRVAPARIVRAHDSDPGPREPRAVPRRAVDGGVRRPRDGRRGGRAAGGAGASSRSLSLSLSISSL